MYYIGQKAGCGCGIFGILSYIWGDFLPIPMNSIDLIVLLVAALALFDGWRLGFVTQLISLAGLAAGIWLAMHYGTQVGHLLRLDEDIATVGGFVVVLLASVIVTAIIARLLKQLCRFAGFGLPDILLGIALSLIKYLVLLSLLFSAFDSLNQDYTLISAQTVKESKFYRPVLRLADALFPFVEWAKEQIPQNQES